MHQADWITQLLDAI